MFHSLFRVQGADRVGIYLKTLNLPRRSSANLQQVPCRPAILDKVALIIFPVHLE